jgi:radical SAM superfamily enzyme YgiQ (UPF0313 family)
VPNFWIKRDGAIHRNPVSPRNRGLDDLPFPARDLYYEQFPILRQHGVKHFIAHRGCPYRCTYCFNDAYNRMYVQDAGDRSIYHKRIRNEVMQRRMTEDSIMEGAELLKSNGIKLLTENILGVPGETYASAMETLRVNQAIRPDVANASIFTPYPKLPLTAYAIEHGYFDGDFDKLSGNYYHETIIRFGSEKERRQIINLRCLFSLRGFLATFMHFARWYRRDTG